MKVIRIIYYLIIVFYKMPPKKNNQKAEKPQEKVEKQTKLFSKDIVEPE